VQIAGIIPNRIGLLLSIETLNLANNQFTGKCRPGVVSVLCSVSVRRQMYR
jgi:hypothetical protein